MGAWGFGSFENDDAQDWLWLLEEAPDGSVLRETLAPVAGARSHQEVDAPEASCALAAAEVVAAASDADGTELPEEARVWLAEHATAVGDDLVELARTAVSRVRASSQLRGLWDEVGSDDWLAIVHDLAARLGGPSEPIADQHEMNRRTWQVFQEQGVIDGTELRLDFFYAPGDKQAADALAEFFRRDTDYEVTVVPSGKSPFKRKWSVEGRTPPMSVSLPILDDWVDWLIQAGEKHGPCVYDGWGASVG